MTDFLLDWLHATLLIGGGYYAGRAYFRWDARRKRRHDD